MNTSNFSHALLALIAQGLIYIATGNLWYGAVFGIAFYLGREVAQQEAHTIAERWGSRAAMPWYEGFLFHRWSTDGKFDLLVPAVAVTVVGCMSSSSVFWRFNLWSFLAATSSCLNPQ